MNRQEAIAEDVIRIHDEHGKIPPSILELGAAAIAYVFEKLISKGGRNKKDIQLLKEICKVQAAQIVRMEERLQKLEG